MKKKTFDCVDFQHDQGERLKRKLEGLSREEQIEFWLRQAEELRRRQASSRALQKSA